MSKAPPFEHLFLAGQDEYAITVWAAVALGNDEAHG
jgi:hypothetical protein